MESLKSFSCCNLLSDIDHIFSISAILTKRISYLWKCLNMTIVDLRKSMLIRYDKYRRYRHQGKTTSTQNIILTITSMVLVKWYLCDINICACGLYNIDIGESISTRYCRVDIINYSTTSCCIKLHTKYFFIFNINLHLSWYMLLKLIQNGYEWYLFIILVSRFFYNNFALFKKLNSFSI